MTEFILGGRPPGAADLRHSDPRWVAQQSERYSDVRQAAWMAAVASMLFVASGAWFVASGGDDVPNVALAVTGIAFGAAAGKFLSVRAGRTDEVDRAIALGSIFYQQPQVLRGLLRDEVIDTFLQNLLRTVMRQDDLGDSLWHQTVSPLVDSLASERYRRGQRYDVVLRRMEERVEVPVGEDATLAFAEDGFWRFQSDLVFERPMKQIRDALWLGLVFDPDGGPAWFARHDFALREYTALPAEYVELLCSRVKAPAVLAAHTPLRSRLRPSVAMGALAAARQRDERLRIAETLCRPRLSIDGTELELDEVALDRRGMAMRFPIPSRVRRDGRREWVRLHARLCFPLPMSICSFPAHFNEPTRGAEVTFDYAGADVVDVITAPFFLVNRPFEPSRVDDREGRREWLTEPDEWVLPGAGIAFSWRLKEIADRPPA